MTSDELVKFQRERKLRANQYDQDSSFKDLSQQWLKESMKRKYVYNFDWLGRPIIQYPQDVMAIQELIWSVKPDLIIETGIAHGGSLILSASMLALLDVGPTTANFNRRVLGIDIEIREHNRQLIEQHPLSFMIEMIESSSTCEKSFEKIKSYAKNFNKVMVFLDSMHTEEHVLKELDMYADLVSSGSYCVVFDTFVENLDEDIFPDRPWSKGDNPMTAVAKFLKKRDDFEIDKKIESKLMVTVTPNGFLKKLPKKNSDL